MKENVSRNRKKDKKCLDIRENNKTNFLPSVFFTPSLICLDCPGQVYLRLWGPASLWKDFPPTAHTPHYTNIAIFIDITLSSLSITHVIQHVQLLEYTILPPLTVKLPLPLCCWWIPMCIFSEGQELFILILSGMVNCRGHNLPLFQGGLDFSGQHLKRVPFFCFWRPLSARGEPPPRKLTKLPRGLLK